MNAADVTIIGAGCAGASLAVHLADRAPDLSVHVVEARTDFPRDRTFCSWHTSASPFDACVSNRWHAWSVSEGGRRVVRHSDRHPYELIASDDFHAFAFERLGRRDRTRVDVGTRVRSVEPRGDEVVVTTDRGETRTGLVFDARPHALDERADDVTLHQSFVGRHVVADRDVFTPGTVTLMDFETDGDGVTTFLYVLPESASRALVEATHIGLPGTAPDLDDVLDRRLDALGARFDARRGERGVLPMSTARPAPTGSPRVIRIGLGGAWARPSSGYTFSATQRACRAIASDLGAGRAPAPVDPWSTRTRFLDRVFLRAVARAPARQGDLFLRACRASGDASARFFAGTSSLLDELSIVRRMPWMSFTGLALSSVGGVR